MILRQKKLKSILSFLRRLNNGTSTLIWLKVQFEDFHLRRFHWRRLFSLFFSCKSCFEPTRLWCKMLTPSPHYLREIQVSCRKIPSNFQPKQCLKRCWTMMVGFPCLPAVQVQRSYLDALKEWLWPEKGLVVACVEACLLTQTRIECFTFYWVVRLGCIAM